MKTVKITSIDKNGQSKNIWYHMPQDALPDLVKRELAKEGVGMVMLENEKEMNDETT